MPGKLLAADRRVPIGAVVVMFVIFTVMLLFLAWRNEEVNRASINRHEDSITRLEAVQKTLSAGIRENCEARNRAFAQYNRALSIRVEAQVQRTPPAERDAIRRELQAFQLPSDDCTRYP